MKGFKEIYTYIEGKTNTAQRPVYCASKYEPIPFEFPACYITEAEHHKNSTYVTLNHDDGHLVRNWEVQVFSNKQSGGLMECFSIMEDIETAFAELAFVETYCGQQQNIDPTITRLVARFTATIGSADTMPETNTQGD